MKRKLIFITLGLIILSGMFSCGKDSTILFANNTTAQVADKTGWTATADSQTPPGAENTGLSSATIDGNINTYWHTDYTASTPPYPHWLLIDMKKSYNLVSVDITNRQAATPNKLGMKTFRLEASNDGTTFTKLGEFPFAITNDPQSFPVSSANAFRFIKITALEPQVAGTPHTFLAEVDVYVTK